VIGSLALLKRKLQDYKTGCMQLLMQQAWGSAKDCNSAHSLSLQLGMSVMNSYEGLGIGTCDTFACSLFTFV